MAEQTELGRFLRARRERVTPTEVGLPVGTGTRRTPGLRREELATLAGVSIDYYTRLERGREQNPSHAVVEALAMALLLSDEERGYLHELATRAARAPRRATVSRERASWTVRETTRQLLEVLRPNPAYVLNRTNDIVAANPGGSQLMPGLWDWPVRRRNSIRYTFLHPTARSLWPDWENKAMRCVAQLRAVAGIDQDAPDLVALLGELLVKSPEFSSLWARYDVATVGPGQKTFLHPEVGRIVLNHEVLQINRTDGQRLVVYMAEPGSADHDGMVLLDMAGAAASDRTASPERGIATPRREQPLIDGDAGRHD